MCRGEGADKILTRGSDNVSETYPADLSGVTQSEGGRFGVLEHYHTGLH